MLSQMNFLTALHSDHLPVSIINKDNRFYHWGLGIKISRAVAIIKGNNSIDAQFFFSKLTTPVHSPSCNIAIYYSPSLWDIEARGP